IEVKCGKHHLSGHNPEEVVALGAAMQAMRRMESESASDASQPTVMIDAIAHSLGMSVESADRSRYINSILIQKNTPLPATQTRSYKMRLRPQGKTQLYILLTPSDSTNH